MGGSGGGGGGAGDVTWPDYVSGPYTKLVGDFDLAGSDSDSAALALYNAQAADPYLTAKTNIYDGTVEIAKTNEAIDKFESYLLQYNAINYWGNLFQSAKQRYLDH